MRFEGLSLVVLFLIFEKRFNKIRYFKMGEKFIDSMSFYYFVWRACMMSSEFECLERNILIVGVSWDLFRIIIIN